MDQWPDLLIDSLFEANAHTAAIQEHARRLAAADFAIREAGIIRALARHPWAWSALGVTAWCQQRRVSFP